MTFSKMRRLGDSQRHQDPVALALGVHLRHRGTQIRTLGKLKSCQCDSELITEVVQPNNLKGAPIGLGMAKQKPERTLQTEVEVVEARHRKLSRSRMSSIYHSLPGYRCVLL